MQLTCCSCIPVNLVCGGLKLWGTESDTASWIVVDGLKLWLHSAVLVRFGLKSNRCRLQKGWHVLRLLHKSECCAGNGRHAMPVDARRMGYGMPEPATQFTQNFTQQVPLLCFHAVSAVLKCRRTPLWLCTCPTESTHPACSSKLGLGLKAQLTCPRNFDPINSSALTMLVLLDSGRPFADALPDALGRL